MSSVIPIVALTVGGVSTFILCLAIVYTKSFHGRHTMDASVGIQKIHVAPTPRIGGLAILLGLAFGWLFVPEAISGVFGLMLVASLPCFLSGIIEDVSKRGGVAERLLATIFSGVFAWWLTGYSLTRVGIIGIDHLLSVVAISVVFTAIAVAGVANAINLIDGFNGLASGTVLVCFSALGLIAFRSGDIEMAKICFAISGAIFGFFIVNFPRGKIFLGDGGAYLLGFLLGWVAVLVAMRNPSVSPWSALLACGYPVLEVLFSIARRRARSKAWGSPDRLHLHSLIWSRVTTKWLKNSPPVVQNAAVFPFILLFALLPASLAVVLQGNTLALIAAFAFTAVVYAAVYFLLLHFRWSSRRRILRVKNVHRLKIVFFANTDWYLYNFRLSLAEAVRKAGHEVILISPAGAYGLKLRELGFRWVPAPMNRQSLNPLKELKLLLWLQRFFKKEQIDLTHGFTIKGAVYGSLAARLAGVPIQISTVAGMGYVFTSESLKARLLRPCVKALLALALGGRNSRLILQNPDDVMLFEQAEFLDPLQIRLIAGSGVSCQRFYPRIGERPAGNFRVLLPARMLWDKGVAEYVEAARLLKVQGHKIDFMLAGEPDSGNPAAVPETTLRSWVDEGLVHWLGHVEDMPSLYRSVDVVALPSYREGLPKGLIEAGSCSLALITTDVPGCRTVVIHGETGLLVPLKDANALAAAIMQLKDDAALCARLGRAAREKVLEEFEEAIVIQRTINVYSELAKNY